MTVVSVPELRNKFSRAARLGPAFAAFFLVFALSNSVGSLSKPPPDPRAMMMVQEGQLALSRGDTDGAIDAFEAALALDPGFDEAFVALADATRAQGLTGKSIDYYRRVLEGDPRHFGALAGEGQALAQKGALAKARRNLAVLQSLCGVNCPETVGLRMAINAGPSASLAAEDAGAAPLSN